MPMCMFSPRSRSRSSTCSGKHTFSIYLWWSLLVVWSIVEHSAALRWPSLNLIKVGKRLHSERLHRWEVLFQLDTLQEALHGSFLLQKHNQAHKLRVYQKMTHTGFRD